MEKIKSLDRYQKILLIITIVILIVFTLVYIVITSRVGFEYKDTIFIPSKENGNITYSGKIQGKQAKFIVYEDKTVEFKYDDKTYGPYTAKEDSTAIPKDSEMMVDAMTGVELRKGEEIIFRGAILNLGDYRQLYNEDGSLESLGISVTTDYETIVDENIDEIEPLAILDLMTEPKLTHKGEWIAWLYGVLICIVTIISILFADELFRLNLSFKIRDVERVEPSDWEIGWRYIGWTVLPVVAVIIFIVGLQ